MDSHRLLPNIPPFLTVPEMISWDHMDPYGTIRFSWSHWTDWTGPASDWSW